MRYEQVQLLCLFDLPMETSKEKRSYRIFRKALIENGFNMIQYSVYARALPNRSALKKYEGILKRYAPKNGNIRLLYVTERQYEEMKLLTGTKSRQEELIGIKSLVVL